ncbi:pyridoxamine 5'-phosphate oxidase family protein [Paenibacillus harenae]|uniref:Pyridoxine 5'-phosphate oxidase superfamily flavin-nucleotide-binding protein n=1 Tax=Paenibacillus harenae TaxID=306543 RepID=A0ABT9U2L9_PAEHA|nr:pyridoxamine 5'-phosphate oxidase family protein [Paenibacillus harenae]MDQ0113243.1 putative pyridoxine 5'-phosphate oxidase superfamily flavin-nucleotide-binding protein [Paenibacillus harenae]
MTNVYHSGELSVQRLAGAEIAAQQNSAIVRANIPKGAVAFLKNLSLMIVASVDGKGRVWSSFLTGEPGFIDVEDEVTITIHSDPVRNDPLYPNLISSPEIGLLAIDFSKRLRMRINGTGYFDADRRIVVKTEQVYGNCPKYIHKRNVSANGVFQRSQKSEQRGLYLNPEQQVWIRNSDTFFIGSISSGGKADVSHRGGPPGFIKVIDEKTLLFPDYYGNSMFNTLGNIYSNPRSGLLFIDFDSGHSLQLTGNSEIIWDENELTEFPAAERIVRFEINEVLFTENNTQLGWDFVEFSPSIPTL